MLVCKIYVYNMIYNFILFFYLIRIIYNMVYGWIDLTFKNRLNSLPFLTFYFETNNLFMNEMLIMAYFILGS